MKASFRKAWTIYKYLVLTLAPIFLIGMVIDDWVFVEKYWSKNWFEYISSWLLYCLVYGVAFSIYFWISAFAMVMVYHRIFKRSNGSNAKN